MKSQIHAVFAATLITALFIFPGCKKAFDYGRANPEETVPCRITKLKFYVIPEGPPGHLSSPIYHVYDYTYDYLGNPRSVMREDLGTADYDARNIEQHFRYDQQNRLTGYEVNYNGSLGVLEWHRYSYPDRHTIVDSTFDYTNSLYNDPEPPHFSSDTYVSVYKLDAKGRIITNYRYDANGNLKRPGVIYDDKVNLYRTNKVWMQVCQDYSVNNPLSDPTQISSYNQLGLPLRFAVGGRALGYDFNTMDVEYDCSAAGSVGKY
jgi:hypothetical protein